MIKIIREQITRKFRENDILITTAKQFHYSTEEEKIKHKKLMEADGYADSGQMQENIGTITEPNYIWFGGYYKYETIEIHDCLSCKNSFSEERPDGDLLHCMIADGR